MQLYPAIDLKDRKCVRLLHGDMEKATVFNDSAGNQAKQFNNAGCNWLHCVDLNGAFAGRSINTEAINDILQNTNAKVQLGGGIRSLEHIAHWVNAGISRVILGTVAVKQPELVKQACKEFPNKIAVGIDAKDGFVATEGWAEKSDLTIFELAQKFEDVGVSAIIYTDINRDGAMGGVNVNTTAKLAKATSIPVIASGGVASISDIRALKATNSGISGVISGRALYDGAINLSEALKVCEE